MSSFLFDILPVDTDVKLTIQLACLLNEEGHEVYYTDSSDSSFTSYLLQKGMGRMLYPGDFRWFEPDLVLLDKRLENRIGFYQDRNIRIVYLGLWFGDKQNLSKDFPLLFLAPSPLDYQDQSDGWLVCAGPLLDFENTRETTLSKREELLLERMSSYKKRSLKLSLFIVTEMAEDLNAGFRFYELVKEFCLQNTQYEIIVCSNSKDWLNRLFPLPVNMQFYLSDASRQLTALGDLLVTNGDLDMLINCIYYSLPVLLLPVTKEQAENTARMVYHGLGLQMDDKCNTVDDFSNQIQILLQHKEDIAVKMDRMSKLFDRKSGQVHYVISWLEKLVNRKEREI
ncbi:hypothetical protein [Parabacteroides sp.]